MNNPLECKHEHREPTGEIRPCAGCKDRDAVVPKPVWHCTDCNHHVVQRGQNWEVVSPPPPFAEIMRKVRQGEITPVMAEAQYGYLSADEKTELRAVTVCAHDEEEIVLIIRRCKCCGRQTTETIEQIAGKADETHCPDCGQKLVYQGGCKSCPTCGWSPC